MIILLMSLLSYSRGFIVNKMTPVISKKIIIDHANEKADFRLIGEITTANLLANTTNNIEEIIMNYENPCQVKILADRDNVNKDITIHLNNTYNNISFERDIKAGNNANNPFSSVMAAIPYTSDFEKFCAWNNFLFETLSTRPAQITTPIFVPLNLKPYTDKIDLSSKKVLQAPDVQKAIIGVVATWPSQISKTAFQETDGLLGKDQLD